MKQMLDQQTITFLLGLAAIVSIIFQVYNSFKRPQIKTDMTTLSLQGQLDQLKAEIRDVKETHLKSLEAEIKNLNTTVNELGKTVIKLATIIDERIPKGSPGLTLPGV